MANFSFDVVSDYDKSEINNVFDQTRREIQNRYDFKNTPAAIEWIGADKAGLKVLGNSDWQIEAVIDIIRKKLAVRGLDQKVLDLSSSPVSSNLVVTKEVLFKKGLGSEAAKKITTLIRQEHPKAKTQIQGEEIRVTSNNKDELQSVITLLRKQPYDFAIQFTNYR
ncbi:MAG TPA: YajQ family cyclic di-GMP-binding protein [Candidatus Saccharimonadales bacterium]|nr:YajQ family cyclic di-GMP-binding protein [Candidatus Saccharimonadales bacterium]